jgi:hypothetical protein
LRHHSQCTEEEKEGCVASETATYLGTFGTGSRPTAGRLLFWTEEEVNRDDRVSMVRIIAGFAGTKAEYSQKSKAR